MDELFDQQLVAANRRRAFRSADPKAGFLLDIAAAELADRLSIVERHFDEAVELHGEVVLLKYARQRILASTNKHMINVAFEGLVIYAFLHIGLGWQT